MVRKGKTPKEPPRTQMRPLDPALQEVLALADDAITPEAKAEASAWAKRIVDGTEPTTLCNEHVPNEERPLECAKCGKPIGSQVRTDGLARSTEHLGPEGVTGESPVLSRLGRDAKETERMFEPPPTSEWRDDEWSDIVTPEEREAPLCAVVTPDELAAILDGPNVKTFPLSVVDELSAESQRLGIRDFPASEYLLPRDAPEPAGHAGMVELSKLWLERADVLAKKRGMGLTGYLEWLIKRDWVASGGRGA